MMTALLVYVTLHWASINSACLSQHDVRPWGECVLPPQVEALPQKWPDGIVYFEFDPGLSQQQQEMARDAMNEWENSPANVVFVPYNGGLPGNRIRIVADIENSSAIGMTAAAPQLVKIVSWDKFVIAHELCHALGFWHEHSRWDRDDHIAVATTNIEAGEEVNFNMESEWITTATPYDFDSVMHYCQFAFTVCTNCSFCPTCPCQLACPAGCETISVKPPNEVWESLIGQRNHLSPLDIQDMVDAYGGAPEVTKEGFDSTASGSLPVGWIGKTTSWLFYQSSVSVESGSTLSPPQGLLLNATPLAIQSLWCQAALPWKPPQTVIQGWYRTDATVLPPSGFNKGYVALSTGSTGSGNVPLLSMSYSPTAGLQFVDVNGVLVFSGGWDTWHPVTIEIDRLKGEIRYAIGGATATAIVSPGAPQMGTAFSSLVLFQWIGGGWWDDVELTAFNQHWNYCTSGTSASGCTASISATGTPSASSPSGFFLTAANVEGGKDGVFFFGTNGRQANPWGNGTSFQCLIPPVKRAVAMAGQGTSGTCDGSFAKDLNAYWNAYPGKNPGPAATVQAQLWYRDPQNTSNQTTSLSDAVEVVLHP